MIIIKKFKILSTIIVVFIFTFTILVAECYANSVPSDYDYIGTAYSSTTFSRRVTLKNGLHLNIKLYCPNNNGKDWMEGKISFSNNNVSSSTIKEVSFANYSNEYVDIVLIDLPPGTYNYYIKVTPMGISHKASVYKKNVYTYDPEPDIGLEYLGSAYSNIDLNKREYITIPEGKNLILELYSPYNKGMSSTSTRATIYPADAEVYNNTTSVGYLSYYNFLQPQEIKMKEFTNLPPGDYMIKYFMYLSIGDLEIGSLYTKKTFVDTPVDNTQ